MVCAMTYARHAQMQSVDAVLGDAELARKLDEEERDAEHKRELERALEDARRVAVREVCRCACVRRSVGLGAISDTSTL
jgi:hypothetical protein